MQDLYMSRKRQSKANDLSEHFVLSILIVLICWVSVGVYNIHVLI